MAFIAIIGLGKTGISCVKYLMAQGKALIAMDTRLDLPDIAGLRQAYPTLPILLGPLDEGQLLQADEIILSPGISLQTPAVAQAIAKGIPVCGDIELFTRLVKAPILGITGTNAKGTVTTLIGDMLRCSAIPVQVGGNIGTPVLDLLDQPEPAYYVLELSSFQLETAYSLKPKVATILNLSEDHLDRHGTMQAYLAAKQRIYSQCEIAVWNRDDKQTYPIFPGKKQLSFGLSKPNSDALGIQKYKGQNWLSHGNERLLAVDELRIKGRHNWANALAALAFGYALNLPQAAMLQALRDFRGLSHRCEWVGEARQVNWYNDSKGTNVGATLAAIEGLGHAIKGKIILIAGGLGKGADFKPLRTPIAEYTRAAILMGRDAPLLANALTSTTLLYHVDSLKNAVALADDIAEPGDVVLLSPACASWDMFRDYNDRGEQFKRAVQEVL